MIASSSKGNAVSTLPFRVVQICLALLLLAAAGLKTHQLATEPVLGSSLLDSRWFLIAVVEFELFFAFWLIAGLLPAWTWSASMTLFAAFALISFFKAISGEASCGCFGRVEVNPWYTFGLDILVVGCLVRWRPQHRVVGLGVFDGRGVRFRLASVLVAWLCAGMSSGVVMGGYQSTRLSDVGGLLGDGRTVILEPETWLGKRFPLLDWIQIDAPLDEGGWTVVLHRPGCSECEELLRRYSERSAGSSFLGELPVAFVDVAPSHATSHVAIWKGPSFFEGRLPDSHEWFVRAPVQLQLDMGFVVSIENDSRR